jgi:hypothetical protein
MDALENLCTKEQNDPRHLRYRSSIGAEVWQDSPASKIKSLGNPQAPETGSKACRDLPDSLRTLSLFDFAHVLIPKPGPLSGDMR